MEWLTEPNLVYAQKVIIWEISILSERQLQNYENPFYDEKSAVVLKNNFCQGHLFHEFIFKKISRKSNFKKST